jgi:hypothetical protein
MRILNQSGLLLLAFSLLAAGARGGELTGRVLNQTKGKASAGDQVVLLRLGEGMQEQAHALTDAQGAFRLPVPSSSTSYVVRVWHEGVNYDKVANGTAPLEINVFEAVARIPGLEGSIGLVEMQSDTEVLKISEMYAINNTSRPPVTQSNLRNFPISLPPAAVLDSVEVKGPGGIWTKAPAKESGEGHGQFNVSFPLRPGETLFKFAYHLPHRDSTTLRLKLAYPIKKFAVLHPASMKFTPIRANTFSHPGSAGGLEVEQAVAEPVGVHVPAFVVSGTGLRAAPATSSPRAPSSGSIAAKPLPPAVVPSSSPQVWWLTSATAAVLLAAILAVWRAKRKPAPAAKSALSTPLIDALKEELFHLESERLHGSIAPEQYTAMKQALNISIERALRNKQ